MNDPIVFDVSASQEANEKALMDALLSGQPLVLCDTNEPDVPTFSIVMELGRVEDGADR